MYDLADNGLPCHTNNFPSEPGLINPKGTLFYVKMKAAPLVVCDILTIERCFMLSILHEVQFLL